ncbi:XRE family transcriptional regulator [Lactococcus lactis subsp. lactis]|uniref:helix-turn-helix domain-containing protein n=1 Tax=Lactococcus lactis TaxID=1358 RepID=UPI00223AE8D0|nr:helix-turn-helix domain-containing protein [Lactococcus lactis]MCT0017762.1 XRE family transcriptional regulator [Lactococcus lactis subsp. lactis]
MTEQKLFYDRLLEQTKLRNQSINQLERELGYPRNALHNYKLGRNPSASRLIELANYLKVSPEFLIGKNVSISEKNLEYFFNNLSTLQKKEILEISEKWFLKQIK